MSKAPHKDSKESKMKENLFYSFADGSVDIQKKYGIKVSDVCLNFLKNCITVDNYRRLKGNDFFNHPFLKDPDTY